MALCPAEAPVDPKDPKAREAAAFAAQQQASRDARLQKELKFWRDREERALERHAREVQEARLEAIHARYVGPMKKFMDLYARKAARQHRALQQAEKLKVELQDMISTRVDEAMKERQAVHAISREVHDIDLLVQVEKERADRALD